MQRHFLWFGLLACTALGLPAQAVSQGDITGTNVWNNNPPIFDLNAPEISELINRVNLFNSEVDAVYTACSEAIAQGQNPRRFARPDSPNATQPLPAACTRLIEFERTGNSLRQEVREVEALYGNSAFLTW
ncbi:MAG: hypothetical protein EA366_13195 [Spirulina sp. DLM2.Bin59]|nr:MAG: hypothetical protein EA366_13195 [Spirulina sp. DLM2.Bin59]